MTLIVCLVGSALLYGYGYVRIRQRARTFSPVALTAFLSGLLVTAAALLGPLDDLSDGSMSWHMVQHLAIITIAAPLLLIGAPLRMTLAALPTGAAAAVARFLNGTPMRTIGHPVFGLAILTLVLYGTHFSPFYERALENASVHAGEHALYLAAALIYWSPIFAIAPAPHAPSHPVRILVLFLSLPISAFLGFAFYVTNHVLYAHYAARPGALADQTNAGAVMWIAAGAPVILALLWCVADWGARERRLGDAYDALERRGPLAVDGAEGTT